METKCRYRASTVARSSVGDLIAVPSDDGFDYAIVISRDQIDDSFLLAVLRPADPENAPHISVVEDTLACANYGNGWLIELDDQLREDQTHENPGSAYVAGASTFITFAGHPDAPLRIRGFCLDLATMQPGRPQGTAFVAEGWRLWIDEGDRDDTSTLPLLEFPMAALE